MRYAKFERMILLVMTIAIVVMAVGMVLQKTDAVEVLGHLLMLAVIVASLYGGRRGALTSLLISFAIYLISRLVWQGEFSAGELAQLIAAKFLIYGILALICSYIRVQFQYFFVKMEEQDLVDDETQIGNARFLLREIKQRMLEYERYQKPFSLVVFSFNPDFLSRTRKKEISLLRDITVNVLKSDTRAVDELARAGNRLVVLLPNVGREGAQVCGTRLQEKINGLPVFREKESSPTMEVLVISYPEDNDAVDEFLSRLEDELES